MTAIMVGRAGPAASSSASLDRDGRAAY